MARYSLRNQTLYSLQVLLLCSLLNDSPNASEDIIDTCLLYLLVSETRYLTSRTWGASRDIVPGYENLFQPLRERFFKQKIRMTREAFYHLLDLFGSHQVFDNSTQGHPVKLQFLVAFHRFGCQGNGASVGLIADYFGISEGSVENYTWNVIKAILSKEKTYIYWPNAAEKRVITEKIESSSGFPGCVGFVDGTLIGLEKRPTFFGEEFYSHKGNYGINTMLICDHRENIRYVSSGWVGSAYDNRIYGQSSLCQFPYKYFDGKEYILADSAYTSSPTVVPAFKEPPGGKLSPRKNSFNLKHSSARVKIEHCIGRLKGKFQSLKGMRLAMRSSEDINNASLYIRACCVLHNILNDDDFDLDEELKDAETNGESLSPSTPAGNEDRRNELLEYLFPV